MAGRIKAALGSLGFLVLAPGVVAGVIPWLITGWGPLPPSDGAGVLRWTGIILIAAGLVIVVEAFARFAWEGLGTPAPIAPTRSLVVSGFYRFVRNPMYVAVTALIFGQAVLFANWGVALYGVFVAAAFHTFVLSYGGRSCSGRMASNTPPIAPLLRAGSPGSGPKGAEFMSLTRVQFFSVSLDGFGTGDVQSLEAPFGHAGERLHEWMFLTRWWHQLTGQTGGSGGIDDAFLRQHDQGVGAEIMGSGKFGPPGWHEDPAWKGWWGPNPPFHTPTFILTHHPRPSIEMEGGTTFHFIDASPAEALETAREAAGGLDVRLGGGVTMIRDFLAAGLVDHMHIAVVPILLGRGERLWDGLEGLEKDYEIEATSSPSGVTHVTFTRAAV